MSRLSYEPLTIKEKKDKLRTAVLSYNYHRDSDSLFYLIRVAAESVSQGSGLSWQQVQEVVDRIHPRGSVQGTQWEEIEL